MAIGDHATLNAATITAATEVELRVSWRPTEQDILIKAAVDDVEGDGVSWTTEAEQTLTGPAGSTLTSCDLEILEYNDFKSMLRFNYGGYLVERFSLAVSS